MDSKCIIFSECIVSKQGEESLNYWERSSLENTWTKELLFDIKHENSMQQSQCVQPDNIEKTSFPAWTSLLIPVAVVLTIRFVYKIYYGRRKRFIDKFIKKKGNIKSVYPFVDHARIVYDMNMSEIVLVNSVYREKINIDLAKRLEPFLNEGTDIKRIVDDSIKQKLPHNREDKLRLRFISHNRSGDEDMDEAHWFRIQLFVTNTRMNCFLNRISQNFKKERIVGELRNPMSINELVPFIGNLAITGIVCFQNVNEEYYTILKKKEQNLFSFLVDRPLQVSDFEASKLDVTGKTLEAARNIFNKIFYNPHDIEYLKYYEIGIDIHTYIVRLFVVIKLKGLKDVAIVKNNIKDTGVDLFPLDSFAGCDRQDNTQFIDPYCYEVQCNVKVAINKKFKGDNSLLV